MFAVKPGARGDLTLPKGEDPSAQVAWSKIGRGSYMPTPIAYRGILYVLANNGVFDAYDLPGNCHQLDGRTATPAMGEGVMHVRALSTLFAIGKR